eukprot:123061-Rhodomonas_salina.1
MVPFHWGGASGPVIPLFVGIGASAMMAVQHINQRDSSLVPRAAELLPADFKLVVDIRDCQALPTVA